LYKRKDRESGFFLPVKNVILIGVKPNILKINIKKGNMKIKDV
jgi:hypothetical protein